MTDEEYKKLTDSVSNVDLVRPHWDYYGYHKKIWEDMDITVLICQRKTYDTTRLCIESLMNFYPDIPILVVDGNSQDRSSEYLNIKSKLYPNISIWTRDGINSHGMTMDEAIRTKIRTRYVLLMDSDVITVRGGWLGHMMSKMVDGTYAVGTLMLVSRKNHACGAPRDFNDVLRYAHPSCSIYDVNVYKTLNPFIDHGAPCCYNMMDAESKGYEVAYFPIDRYVAHLSGGSWTEPRVVWAHDIGTFMRPFITFVVDVGYVGQLTFQTDKDFDVIFADDTEVNNVVIHGNDPVIVKNNYFNSRFNVKGEFVCEIHNDISSDFVESAKREFIGKPYDRTTIENHQIIKRQIWQKEDALR